MFTPGAVPTYTYIPRDEAGLEKSLREGLETPGLIVSVSGPSKSGKTVLVEKVVGKDNLIPVTGATLKSAEQLWEEVLDWKMTPNTVSEQGGDQQCVSFGADLGGTLGVVTVGSGNAKAALSGTLTSMSNKTSVRLRGGMTQVIREVSGGPYVIFIDDFHYMGRDVQTEVAKQIKEAAHKGVRICTASVPHRSDDVVRANPELRGRVVAVDLDYWKPEHLRLIAERGFEQLKVGLNGPFLDGLVREAARSPQLMQSLCLRTARHLGVNVANTDYKAHLLDDDDSEKVCHEVAKTMDFRSLVNALDTGPKERGTARTTFRFHQGGTGDVYRALLRGISANPPQLTFKYKEICERLESICAGDAPVGSSIIRSCEQMVLLARKKFPAERVVEWEGDVLEIVEPYLLFYLRWSGHLDIQ